MNLAQHLASTVLLFLLLRRLTGRPGLSFLVAALFAVHPQHVESVAWACERKDTLSTFFWILTLWLYARYAERPGWLAYLLVLVSFALGLLTKPMLVTLPCALLLLDYWPLARFKQGTSVSWLVLEKLPLFVLAVGTSFLTARTQAAGGAILTLRELPLSVRLGHAVASYGWYLEKAFWPTGLALFWPHPRAMPALSALLVSGSVILGVTALALLTRRRQPWLLVGWLWFVGTLVPVIGLVQAGDQAVADRFSYVPHVGLFVAVVWAAAELLRRWRVPALSQGTLSAIVLAMLVALTVVQVSYWRDTETVWSHALAVRPNNPRAHCNLGVHLLERGEVAAARRHLEQSVRLYPDNVDHRRYLGQALCQDRDWDAAALEYEEILRRDKQYAEAWCQLGVVRTRQGRLQQALECLQRANRLTPGSAPTLGALGDALWQLDRQEQASDCWREALQLNPAEPRALLGQGLVNLRAGRAAEAVRNLAAAAYVSNDPEALSLLGLALARAGKGAEALTAHRAAVQIERQHRDAKRLALYRRRLASALQDAGQADAARQEREEALRLDPAGNDS
jgi:tetratricopeptide (TPR) repeat protein